MNDDDCVGVRNWEVGLCDCFRHCVPNCCMVTFCPCVSLAQIASRLGVLSYSVTLFVYFVAVCTLCTMSGLVSYKAYYVYHDDNHWHYDTVSDGWEYDRRVQVGTEYTVYRIVWVAVEVSIFAFVWHLRTTTRERFNIPGICFGDCLTTFFCMCCAMAQVATHIKSYKPGSCDFGPPDTLPAYPSQQPGGVSSYSRR